MNTFQKVVKYCALALAIALIVGIAGGVLRLVAVLGLFDGGTSSGETVLSDWTVTAEITELKMELRSLEVEILEGETFTLETDSPYVTVKEQGNTLTVKEKKNNSKDGTMTLWIPKGHTFRKVEIEAGAGEFTIQSLSAEVLDLALGAGEMTVESLTVTDRAEIDGGAGKITVCNGSICDLDVDMGVGELSVTARLSGTADLDCGVGKTMLNLIGSPEDYRLLLDKGLGSATFNGGHMSNETYYGNGNCIVTIDGGIGAIEIHTIEE